VRVGSITTVWAQAQPVGLKRTLRKLKKGRMKKTLAVIGLAALLAGCASNNAGMGGTGDESMKTDSINQNSNGSEGMGASSAPANSTWGQGGNTAPNNGTGE